MGIFNKIKNIRAELTTYGIGLLQAKAFRILNTKTAEQLKEYGMSPVEWALLGLLYEHSSGLPSALAAGELGVEAPFITALGDNLEKLKLIERKNDGQDKRIKMLRLTASGKTLVPKLEKILQHNMRFLLQDASIREILAYRKILHTIVENSEKKPESYS